MLGLVTPLLITNTEERCGDIAVEGGVGQVIAAMKVFKESSGIQTWGAYALCRVLYCNSKRANTLEYREL